MKWYIQGTIIYFHNLKTADVFKTVSFACKIGPWSPKWVLGAADQEAESYPMIFQGSAARKARKGYLFLGGAQSIFLGGTWIHRDMPCFLFFVNILYWALLERTIYHYMDL